MARKPNRSHEKDGKTENEKVRSLSKALKERDREIFRLKQELKTLNDAFQKSAAYMSSQSKSLKVEELISAANKEQTLEEAKKQHEKLVKKVSPPSQEELDKKRQETLERIKAWRIKEFGEYEEE